MAWVIWGFWRDMSDERGRDGPRGAERLDDKEDVAKGSFDTEGGGSHLVHVIAHNTLMEIIHQAKAKVSVDEGSFRIPSYIMDKLLVRCERVLLNYGEAEALDCMVKEIRAHLVEVREYKARDNERKVRERLPSNAHAHHDQHRRA
jgi:hypothetical protein